MSRCVVPVVAGVWIVANAFAQPPKVDFARDVQPIFRQNCYGCHGPALASGGLRLDRRSSVFQNGLRRVVPRSTANSFLYHRVSGSDYGMQMPPTGPLRPAQVATIKAWIEQGAQWPDALANEMDRPPLNSKAVAMVESLRRGDRQAFLKAAAEDPKLLNARGPEGSTPFQYAVLYGDAAIVEQLLKDGADPNLRNDAGATPLMWAAGSAEKTGILLAHGAEVNAVSDSLRTPLMIAAGLPAGRPVVKLLLEHGANPNPTKHPDSESSPLIQTALAGDADTMQLVLDHGADVKASAAGALGIAYTQGCGRCVDLLLKQHLDKSAYTMALLIIAPFAGVNDIRAMLDRGADVNAVDPLGRTALMYAAENDLIPVDVVKLLIERGANVNIRSTHPNSGDTGMSLLDIARTHGDNPVADLLAKAGVASAVSAASAPIPRPAGSVQQTIRRSLPLLQRGDAGFTAKSGCISCHSDSLAATAVGLARSKGFPVDEGLSAQQVRVNASYLEHERDSLHQGTFAAQSGTGAFQDGFGPGLLAYILIGLDAEHYPPDLNTDAVAMYIQSRQMPDGHWPYPAADSRPPLCSDYIGQTALSLRGIQLYAPKSARAESAKAVQLAAAWLARTESIVTTDAVWRVLGLAWAGGDHDALKKAQRELLDLQRANGGWADLPSMEPDAYATGRALVALETSGIPVSDPAYRRGMQYLLSTQMEDGSWYVKTRALALQPYFDSGFSHGVNQAISAAGSAWATMALALGVQPPAGKPASGEGNR